MRVVERAKMSSELAPNAEWVHENSAEIRIKVIRGHTKAITSCQLIDNDQKIFTCADDNTARIWDFNSGEELQRFQLGHGDHVVFGRVTNDNKKFITCSWDKMLKFWDVETGKLLWENKHQSMVTACGISGGDSDFAISASELDYKVHIWDTATGKLIHEISDIHSNTITCCKFTPKDDRIMTTSMDKTTKFFDMISRKNTLTLSGHSNVISSCSFTPDERNFATASWDRTVQIWDIATGMYRKNGPIKLEKGHEGSISCCEMSADGSMCVSGGYDLRLVLWDVNFAKPKLTLRGHSDWITDTAITSDNCWVLSVSKDKEIRLWDIENCESIKVVAEQNFILGKKIVNCTKCLRAFSMAKMHTAPFKSSKKDTPVFCVFCRMHENSSLDDISKMQAP